MNKIQVVNDLVITYTETQSVSIAGAAFREKAISSMRSGQHELILKADPDNAYDSHAVMVLAHISGVWTQIGFVPKSFYTKYKLFEAVNLAKANNLLVGVVGNVVKQSVGFDATVQLPSSKAIAASKAFLEDLDFSL